jgi:large subunit ribosomal protein L13
MSTYFPSPSQVTNEWLIIDAKDQILGRLATRVATVLMGKHKPDYTPFLKTGDHVIVINAEKVRLTGKKEQEKIYHHYTGYPGGIRSTTPAKLRQRFPERLIEAAVHRMLPKNKLGKQLTTRLKVYAGDAHPHEAQNPKALTA